MDLGQEPKFVTQAVSLRRRKLTVCFTNSEAVHFAKETMPSLKTLLYKSIPELRKIFLELGRPVPKGFVEALETDSRQGAQQLAKRIRERWRSNRAEGQRLHFLLRYEIDLWLQGFNLIAGVDE